MAEPPMPATTRPPGDSWGSSRGLHAPERVAQVVGESRMSASRPDGSTRSDRLGGQSLKSGWLRRAGSTDGKMRAPAVITLSAPIVTPSPSTAPPSMRVLAPMRTPAATIAVAHDAVGPMSVPSWTTARSTIAPSPTRRRGPARRRLPTWAPWPIVAPGLHDARAARCARGPRRRCPPPGRRRPGARARASHVALEDVEGRLEVALGRPDVEPVAARREAPQAVADQLGEDLALDRDVAPRGDQIEHVALEDVGAGVDEVGVDLVGAGLLQELADGAVVLQAHQAVVGGVVDRDQRDASPRRPRPRAGRAAR